MARTNATRGRNAVFGIEGETPGTYVAVAEVTSIRPPSWSRDAVEATHLTSDDDYKEFIAGIKEAGEAQMTLNWVPSATDAMVAAFADDFGNYQITAPNGVRLQFSGFFLTYEPGEMTPEGKMTASVTIKASGKPALVAAA
jgi:predicted secreted protein